MQGKNGADVSWYSGDEAAKTLVEWAKKLDMSKSGQYWAPRGPSTLLYLTVLVLCKQAEKKC
jgi:hypothetical protein